MNFTYLAINIGSIFFPLLFTFHPRLQFHKTWKAFWAANFISTFIFICWDIYYTHIGVWGFNPDYTCGIYFFNLPIEEVLFFICIPYASVFTYHCIGILNRQLISENGVRFISGLLVLSLVTIGIFSYPKLYTSVTFLMLSIFIFIITFLQKAKWLGKFYIFYIIILFPFFVVNGILTGTSLEKPIVWYNDNENLGLRMLTIPIEDTFYGMLLLILNVSLYEYFKKMSDSKID